MTHSLPRLLRGLVLPLLLLTSTAQAELSTQTSFKGEVTTQIYEVIARGTAPVSHAVVGRFDPTLLTNGQWDIVVQATDLNGLTGSEKVTVRVKGDLKLGHFSFTVTDVEVPLAGIPIRVTRTYDTRRRSENLDFGHGWSVGYQDGKVEESRPLGQYWDC